MPNLVSDSSLLEQVRDTSRNTAMAVLARHRSIVEEAKKTPTKSVRLDYEKIYDTGTLLRVSHEHAERERLAQEEKEKARLEREEAKARREREKADREREALERKTAAANRKREREEKALTYRCQVPGCKRIWNESRPTDFIWCQVCKRYALCPSHGKDPGLRIAHRKHERECGPKRKKRRTAY